VFFEVHRDPAQALSDGPNALRLRDVASLLDQLIALRQALRQTTR
jgi:2-dehydro-3-deoxyphosphooctonate aldolase (KDO 8-P synthase)